MRWLTRSVLATLLLPAMAHAQSYSKTETIEYHDDLNAWVLGQVARTTTNGVETSRTTFTAQAQPEQQFQFGRLVSAQGYHADGSVAWVADGNGNTTKFANYKRGIPQFIHFADGTSQSAHVDDNGWIAWVTDEAANATCYGYDAMGRLASTTYTSENQTGVCDESAWAAKRSEFVALTDADLRPPGVLAGQWRQTVRHGNYRQLVYFDALWRPVLSQEYDESDVAATLRSVSTEYDAQGRVAFQSYPSSELIPPALGTWTTYDALGRITQVQQDSEQGRLSTRTEYLSGLRTRVTNPRGFATTTHYRAYDTPGYELPVGIEHAEGAYTDILRDGLDRVSALRRRNADGSQDQWRRYVYQGDGQLCKVIEDETGATVFGYDGAGNATHTVSGLSGLDNPTTCDHAAAFAAGRTVQRKFDARNRLTELLFPYGLGNQAWAYTATGQVASVLTLNTDAQVINAYSYNRRGLLAGESMEQVGWYRRSLGYGYDVHGHLATQVYPSTLTLSFAPNALGQATRVQDQFGAVYASDAQYHPTGAVKQLRYGNGVVRSVQTNTRGLPARMTDSGQVLDQELVYDGNGNLLHAYDRALGPAYDRHMSYDGLDRLSTAASITFGGDFTYRFGYDALDNLNHWTGGNKDYAHFFYQQGKLVNVLNSANATVIGMAYDAQGNVSQRNGQRYTFDLGNRLRESNGPQGQQKYRYDAHGRRVTVWDDVKQGNLSLYSFGGTLLYDEDFRQGRNTEYLYLGGQSIAQRIIGHGASQYEVKYVHTDALGSVSALSNQAGQATERTLYEPFGKVLNATAYQGMGYTGHVHDSATGLVNMQQRYMDPDLGRFLSVDPVTAYANPGHNFNRYVYANNNPYRYVDPDGEVALPGFVIGAGLEIVRQAVTGEIKDTSFKGIASNVGKALVAGAAGAAGAGIASGVARLSASIAVRAVGNSAAGAAIGAASTGANNAIDGKNVTDGVGKGALYGGAFGAAGSVAADKLIAVKKAFNSARVEKIPLADRNLLDGMQRLDQGVQVRALGTGASDAAGNVLSNSGTIVEACGEKKKC